MIASSIEEWFADLDPPLAADLDSHGYPLRGVIETMDQNGVKVVGVALRTCQACARTVGFPMAVPHLTLQDTGEVYLAAIRSFDDGAGCMRSVSVTPTLVPRV